MGKTTRFFRAVTETRPLGDHEFNKTPDRNAVIWFHVNVGRWMFMLSTFYVADMYGYIGSDSTEVKLVVCRNPK